MALSLDTGHALYGNLISFICVSDSELADLVTPSRTFTEHADSSYGTGTWGAHFSSADGGASPKGASISPDLPDSTNSNPNQTKVFIFNNIATNVSSNNNFLANSTGGNYATLGLNTANKVETAAPHINTNNESTTTVAGIGTVMITLTRTGETSHEVYVNTTKEIDITGKLGWNSNDTGDYIGGFSGWGSVVADFVYIIEFDKVLNSTEISDLYNSLGANNSFAMLQSAGEDINASLAATETTTYQATVSAALNLTASLAATESTTYQATVSQDPLIETGALKNNTGTVWANETGVTASVYDISTGALVVRKTGLISDANGVVSFTDGAMTAGVTYQVIITLSSNVDGLDRIQAS